MSSKHSSQRVQAAASERWQIALSGKPPPLATTTQGLSLSLQGFQNETLVFFGTEGSFIPKGLCCSLNREIFHLKLEKASRKKQASCPLLAVSRPAALLGRGTPGEIGACISLPPSQTCCLLRAGWAQAGGK